MSGDAAAASRLFTDVVGHLARVLGPDDPETLVARSNEAYWTGESGDAAAALRLYTGLVPDEARVLGPDHPDTAADRAELERWRRLS